VQKKFNEKNINTVFLQIDQGTNLYRERCSVDIREAGYTMLTFCMCLDLKRSLIRINARSETLLFASNGFCGEKQPFSLLSNIVVHD
jgi:hypothetical protein